MLQIWCMLVVLIRNMVLGCLSEKSLINIWRYNSETIVKMHGLIESMGKKIVRQQSTWPAKRNRLWFYEDVICVVEKNKVCNVIVIYQVSFHFFLCIISRVWTISSITIKIVRLSERAYIYNFWNYI
jgi:hypothetical protein